MELIKDIYFNTDKLVENTTVKVSYTGKFYQNENDKVFIHYGYGKNWNNINDVEMKKTDLGYQTELNLTGEDTLNFCFKNQNNEWDNNFGNNYIFNIEKSIVNNLGKTTVGTNAENSTSSFYGKTFGIDENNQNHSNVYWNINELQGSEKTSANVSGVLEDTIVGSPESIDTIIGAEPINNTIENTIENIAKTPIINTAADIKAAVGTGVTGDTIPVNTIFATFSGNSNPINNTIGKKQNINTVNLVKNNTTSNSLAVISNELPWAQKLKSTVCKFFSYVPKFISGNYKRFIGDKKNTQN